MIDNLRKEFEKVYFSNVSTTKGLENLAINIGVSKNSLRRFLGKIKNDSQLRISTLNLISERLGFSNFQDFCESSESGQPTLDFELLDIYYGIVKGKGTSLNDIIFQKANFYFAEKILSNPNNLKEFLKRFAENEEALEYVLAWHPCYEKIAHKEYQEALLKLAKITSKAHIKVFAYSFVYFGKFMSESLEIKEADKLMLNIEKQVINMRKESETYMAFPEARYTIAKHIHTFLHSQKPDGKEITPPYKFKNLTEDCGVSFSDQFIFRTYVSNVLNVLKDYDKADLYFNEIPSEIKLKNFTDENLHLRSHLYLYQITRAITLLNLGKSKESLVIFDSLPIDINEGEIFLFDSKIYFELQYYFLGQQLYPKREDFKLRFEILIQKTQFTYLTKI